MTYRIRPALAGDVATVLPMTLALNAHEGIAVDAHALEAALAHLLATPALGGVWLIVDLVDAVIGYALVTFGYDLEFGGRDAWLTELWVAEHARARGAGRDALALLELALPAHGVHALHLQVRPDNPARRLYERHGYVASPRIVMTRKL